MNGGGDMNDEVEKKDVADATPNRGRRRDAPTIEGEAIAETPPIVEPPPRAASDARSPLVPALPGIAALLLSGAALYYALNPDIPTPPPSVSPEAVAALGQRLDKLEFPPRRAGGEAGAGDFRAARPRAPERPHRRCRQSGRSGARRR